MDTACEHPLIDGALQSHVPAPRDGGRVWLYRGNGQADSAPGCAAGLLENLDWCLGPSCLDGLPKPGQPASLCTSCSRSAHWGAGGGALGHFFCSDQSVHGVHGVGCDGDCAFFCGLRRTRSASQAG